MQLGCCLRHRLHLLVSLLLLLLIYLAWAQSSHPTTAIKDGLVLQPEAAQPSSMIVTMTMAGSKPVFDAEKVLKLFSSCRGENDTIFLNCYVDAYEELCKLFRLFGTVFSFVSTDVEDKIEILRAFSAGSHASDYSTVQGLLSFEVTNKLTDNKKQPSGARTLLRLHRAMEFITAFLQKLRDSDNGVKFSSASMEAYDTTLSKHHPWLIRKAVHLALYMLPSRPDLLTKMGLEDNERSMQGMSDLIQELKVIYDVIQKLYAQDNLLQLP